MAIDYVGKNALSYEQGKQLEPISQIVLRLGTDDEGNELVSKYPLSDPETGRIIEYDLPLITSATVANNIAQSLFNKLSNYTYKPFEANSALLDPAMQTGDFVSIDGDIRELGTIVTTFDRQSASDISLPMSNEEDHEFGSPSQLSAGEIKRLVARTAASIETTINSIVLSVVDTEGVITPASIVAAINGSESSVKISADHVNITGYVTFSDLSGNGTTTINGANIKTGKIDAERIGAGTLHVGDATTRGSVSFYDDGAQTMWIEASGQTNTLNILGALCGIVISCSDYLKLQGSSGLLLDTSCYGPALPTTNLEEGRIFFKTQ